MRAIAPGILFGAAGLLARCLLFEADASFATSWPPFNGPAPTDEERLEDALSADCAIGVVRILDIRTNTDSRGDWSEVLDVQPIEWFSGVEPLANCALYPSPWMGGFGRIRQRPIARKQSVIVVLSRWHGRLYVSNGPWSFRGGIAPATAQDARKIRSMVARLKDGLTLEGLARRAATVVVGRVGAYERCSTASGQWTCVNVAVTSVIDGEPVGRSIRVHDPLPLRADTTQRLFFLDRDSTGIFHVVGFVRGSSEIERGRLSRFNGFPIELAAVRIRAVRGATPRRSGRLAPFRSGGPDRGRPLNRRGGLGRRRESLARFLTNLRQRIMRSPPLVADRNRSQK
jgi:hypothetical protein